MIKATMKVKIGGGFDIELARIESVKVIKLDGFFVLRFDIDKNKCVFFDYESMRDVENHVEWILMNNKSQ